MKYREYKGLDLNNVATEILEFWEEKGIFQKSIDEKDAQKPFVFFEGPPSANGLPGIHHVMGRTIKDIFCRYKTLQGYQVKRKAGWDTHGLPIELGVEKELGITKEDIGTKISVEDYNEACKKAVMRYTDVWEDLTRKMGNWVDMENPYVTYQSKYMETVWWLLAQLYNKKLLYKGYSIQPYSPKAGTGLSSHELNQPGTYKDVTDTTVIAQFKILSPTLSNGKGVRDVGYLTGNPEIAHLLLEKAKEMRANPTQAEAILWEQLKSKNLEFKFRQQHLIEDFIVDFVCLSKKLIIEVDGKIHDFQVEKDAERTKIIEDKGFKIIRFTNEEVIGNIDKVISKIENELKVLPFGKDLGWDNTYLLAWTTTPWTLPSNTALTVGKKIDYVVVETFNQYTFESVKVILAKNLVPNIFANKFFLVETLDELKKYQPEDKKIPFFIHKEIKGSELVGIKYEQLLPYAQPYYDADKAFVVISGDFVTTEDGTGIVHTAPTFGADDAQVAKEYGIPPMLVLDENDNPVPLVNLQGKFTHHMGELAGKYVKNEYYDDGEAPERSVDVELVIKLKEENKAFVVEKYKHTYPHCWRTDKPVLYYPLDSWFIKVTDKKEEMFQLNETINWKPKATGEGRFGNWLKNANDWNLSRSRFWGIPLPIWRTEDKTEEMMVDSVATLKLEMQKSIEKGFMPADIFPNFVVGDMSDANYENIDLHKNFVDKIILVSPSGKPMNREADLIDVWFDSGAMPYAQWHYPFENKELIDENKFFPADFIAEGVDQTRGWFYTLHAISTMVFDSVAYKNVVSNGLVLDKNGQKMSKRLGNTVDAFDTLKNYSPDATRWYMIVNANPWDNLKFDLDGIDEVRRKFFGTLYNTYSFFALYANIDQFKYKEPEIPILERPEIDRWILSELNTLINNVENHYNDYEPTKAAREIQYFVIENLSNWFVRLSRRRFWKGDYQTDKISAYQTLYTCLLSIAKMASPIAPFFTDQLYKDLTAVTGKEKHESVHLTDFPIAKNEYIDESLQRRMNKAQDISSLVLSLRKKEMIKVRQPLQKIMIPVNNEQDRQEILAVQNLILSEVNVKEIELLDDSSDILIKHIKPNFKLLGPKFGKDMKLAVEAIQKFNQEDVNKIEKDGVISFEINGKLYTLALDEVEIASQDIEGWLVANQGNLTVALDITITDELRDEGYARELINRVQNLRKDSGFDVVDKIKLIVQKHELLDKAIKQHEQYIKNETLTSELQFAEQLEKGTEIVFDEISSCILIEKL